MSDTPYDGLLENVPSDPEKARIYADLLALYKQQINVSENGGRESPEEFRLWDQRVQSLLSARERAFLLEPHIKTADPNDPDIERANRLNHLTKILIFRQGIATKNGFNG